MWVSVALHVVAACALVVVLRTQPEQKLGQHRIDTHTPDVPQVQMRLELEEADATVMPTPTPSSSVPTEPLPPEVAGPPRAASPALPRTLPAEMLALIRKPVPPSTRAASTKTPRLPKVDPKVMPASGATASATPPVRAIHGMLKPAQTVVYVLDASGSMGAEGKFDAARAALVATLSCQPATVHFQVIVYGGSAAPLLASGPDGLPATGANIRAAAEKLAALEPRGRSNHLEAVRAALAFHPDVILILTDADDLTPAPLKRLLASASKPVPVCIARVGAGCVERPREVR